VINKKIEYIDENIVIEEVNGLKLYFMPKKGFSKSFAQISVKYGSNDYKFSVNGDEFKEYPLGIAHFLEHKLFEQKHGNIFDKFTMLGSSPNAYTNYSETCYYFNATTDFYENLKLLLDFVYNPYFTEENVEKEKGIIEQEIRMYEDNQVQRYIMMQ
jgi:predicted Zn-dependent peptidase